MALTDDLIIKVQPASDDTFIKNLIGDADLAASGSGTLTLVNDSGLYGWNVQGARSGTFTGGTGYEGDACTLAIRLKCVARLSNFAQYFVVRGAGNTGYGPRVSNAGSSTGTLRASEQLSAGGATIIGTSTYTTGNYITLVIRLRDNGFSDGLLAMFLKQVGRVNNNPDATTSATAAGRTTALSYIDWAGSGENITFTDVAVWNRGLTDEEAALVADDIRGALTTSGETLAAALVANATSEAMLTTSINMVCTITGVATVLATLDTGAGELDAVLSSTSTTTADLSTAIVLAASLLSESGTTATLTTSSVGFFNTPVLKNNTGEILSNETGVIVNVYNPTTGVLIVRKTNLTSDGNGIVTVSDALLVVGTYAYEVHLTSNGRRLPTVTIL